MPDYSPYAIQHINLSVPNGTLALAEEFYGEILGFPSDPVPQLQRDTLRWFHVGDGPQQVGTSCASDSDPRLIRTSRHGEPQPPVLLAPVVGRPAHPAAQDIRPPRS